ncbi:hypothetical protein [Crenobacter cavernae]|uniref:hypothetical protein n=1 Tax=Crenobacter cavernae TaxID=2290923 RepID=UPI0011C0729C|nr:hypothetical protein [Crenobacter cavernae]
MKWLLTITGLLVLIGGLVVGFLEHVEVMTAALFSFVALLITANLDRISEFKASSSGIEGKTREIIERAESTLFELQLLAKNIGGLTLSLVKRSGRLGGYGDDEQEDIKNSVLEVLRKIGIRDSEFPKILADWDIFIEFDYANAILGGSMIPEGAGGAVLDEWKSLRHGGIARVPQPAEIRAFLDKHGFMSDDREEYLKDYEFFHTNKEHRRPEVWRNRQHWGPVGNS